VLYATIARKWDSHLHLELFNELSPRKSSGSTYKTVVAIVYL
jgi:hypothetical protein